MITIESETDVVHVPCGYHYEVAAVDEHTQCVLYWCRKCNNRIVVGPYTETAVDSEDESSSKKKQSKKSTPDVVDQS